MCSVRKPHSAGRFSRAALERRRAISLIVAFVIIDGSFVIAGLPKFVDCGWVPFSVAMVLCP